MKRKFRKLKEKGLAKSQGYFDDERISRRLCSTCKALIEKTKLTAAEFKTLSSCKCMNKREKKKHSFFRGFQK